MKNFFDNEKIIIYLKSILKMSKYIIISRNKKYIVNFGSVHKNKFFIFSTVLIYLVILRINSKYFNLYLLIFVNGSIIFVIIFSSSFSIR